MLTVSPEIPSYWTLLLIGLPDALIPVSVFLLPIGCWLGKRTHFGQVRFWVLLCLLLALHMVIPITASQQHLSLPLMLAQVFLGAPLFALALINTAERRTTTPEK